MTSAILLTLFYVLTPALLIFLTNRIGFFKKIGAVLLAYIIGLLAGNLGIVSQVHDFNKIQEVLNSLTILLAIPLLLFSLNIKNWLSIAGKAFTSMFIGMVSVVIAVTLGYLIFKGEVHNASKIGGMLVGVYTGGTPNLAAIQLALRVDPDTYIMVNSVDIVISTVYLFFLMSLGNKFLRWFLPRFQVTNQEIATEGIYNEDDYSGMMTQKGMIQILIGLGYSLFVAAISIGLSFIFTGGISMLVLILSITTLAIAASLTKRIKNIQYTFQSGMYLILVFCVVVASMANLNDLGNMAYGLLKYLSFVVFGSLFLHILLGRIFKVDSDTLIITSTALICSPPFVPVMAGILKNKQIIVSGLTVGIIGYAIGNYLGVTIAYLLSLI